MSNSTLGQMSARSSRMKKSVPPRPNRTSWPRAIVVFDVFIGSLSLDLMIVDRRTAPAQHPKDELAWRETDPKPFLFPARSLDCRRRVMAPMPSLLAAREQ